MRTVSLIICTFISTQGLQPGLVETFERVGEHSRLLTEPSAGVEIPESHASRKTDRPFPSCVISGKLDTLYLLMHITYYNI